MNVNKSTNNNKRKLDNEEFSWSDDEIQLLLKVTLGYKFTCQFASSWWSFTHMVKIRTKIEISSIKILLVQN